MSIQPRLPPSTPAPTPAPEHKDARCTLWRNHVTNVVIAGSVVAIGYGGYERNLVPFVIGIVSLVGGGCTPVNYWLHRLAHLSDINTTTDELKQENRRLSATANRFQKSAEEEKKEQVLLRQGVDDFKEQNNTLREVVITANDQTQLVQSLQAQLAATELRYRQDVAALEEKVTRLEALNTSLERQIQTLSQNAQAFAGANAKLEQENQTLSSNLQRFEHIAAQSQEELTHSLQEMQRQYHEASELERQLRQDITTHEAHLHSKREELQQLDERTDAALTKLQAEEAKLETMSQQILAATQQLAEYARIKEQVDQTEQQIRLQIAALDERERLLNQLSEEIDRKANL